MQVLVIGQGPAAERRTSILTALGNRPSRSCNDNARLARLPDAAMICAPIETRVAIAAKWLRLGVPAVFIEQPLATSLTGLGALRHAAADHIVMVGCNLRFAYSLPPFRWASVDIIASKTMPVRIPGLISQPSARSKLENAIHELDLAYSVNGPIQSAYTICERAGLKISVEHKSMASSHIELDWSSQPVSNRVALSAYDDGGARRVLHHPQCVTPAHDYVALRAETAHFLECARTGSRPCATLADGTHVLEWGLVVTSKDGRASERTLSIEG